jgi:hypothetical protein
MPNHAQKTTTPQVVVLDPPLENPTRQWAYSSSAVPNGVRANVLLGVRMSSTMKDAGRKNPRVRISFMHFHTYTYADGSNDLRRAHDSLLYIP